MEVREKDTRHATGDEGKDTRHATGDKSNVECPAMSLAEGRLSHPQPTAGPRIRFKGCKGEWERGILTDFCELNPKTVLPDVFEYVDLESVKGTELLNHRTESKATAPSRAQRLAVTNDVFYSTVRPYLRNNYFFSQKENEPYVFSTGYAQLRPIVDPDCLFASLQTNSFVGGVVSCCSGSGYPAISPASLAIQTMVFPRDEIEQHKVGATFTRLDTLIAAARKRCERLRLVKQSMLVKMFPQPGTAEGNDTRQATGVKGEMTGEERQATGDEGKDTRRATGDKSNVESPALSLAECRLSHPLPPTHPRPALIPEIRFKGFTDEWKVAKLNKFLTPSTECNLDGRFSRNDVLSVSGEHGIVNQIKFKGRSFAGVSIDNYHVVEVGDIVYTKSPLNANPFGIIKSNQNEPGVVSVLYAVYKPQENCCADFVQTYFALDSRLNGYLRPLIQKGAKNTILVSDENAIEGNVLFPTDLAEQRKIAAFFRNLDALISASEKRVEKLKQVKSSLLERMFVDVRREKEENK